MYFFIYALEKLYPHFYHGDDGAYTSPFTHPQVVFVGSIYRHRDGIDSVERTVFAIPDADIDKQTGTLNFLNRKNQYGQRRAKHTGT